MMLITVLGRNHKKGHRLGKASIHKSSSQNITINKAYISKEFIKIEEKDTNIRG